MVAMLSNDEIEKMWKHILSEVKSITSLPEVIVQLVRELGDNEVAPEKIEQIIMNDAALTAKVLRVANSAFYGRASKVEKISEAVVLLGLNTLRNMVITLVSSNALKGKMTGYGLDKGELYLHSIAAAVGARMIAKHNRIKENEKYYVAGLLHDIGKILISPFIGENFEAIREMVTGQNKFFDAAERDVLGFDHCDVGAELAKGWSLPQILIDANKFHPSPGQCDAATRGMVEVIHIADHMSYSAEYGIGVDGNDYELDESLLQKYEIDPKYKKELIEQIKEETDEVFKSIAFVSLGTD